MLADNVSHISQYCKERTDYDEEDNSRSEVGSTVFSSIKVVDGSVDICVDISHFYEIL